MLFLIYAHRNEISLVQQDVGGHQAGIGKQTGVDVVSVLLGFILKLRHAGKFAELCIAVENPGELGMFRHMALNEKDALFQIDTHGQQQGIGVVGVFAERGRVLTHGDGVQIGQCINGIISVLQGNPVLSAPR